MRKLILFLIILIVVPSALAQSYPKVEVYAGFAHLLQKSNSGRADISEGGETFSFQPCAAEGADVLGSHLQGALCHRQDFHGFDASVKYNVSRYVGLRGDVSLLYNKDRAVDTFGDGADAHTDTNNLTEHTYLALAGVQIGDNAAGKWRPFAHALVGAARQTSLDRQTSTGPFDFTLRDSVTSLALKIGGGIDVAVSSRVDVRVIEVNYVPIFAGSRRSTGNADFDQTLHGRTANNLTFSFGLVFH